MKATDDVLASLDAEFAEVETFMRGLGIEEPVSVLLSDGSHLVFASFRGAEQRILRRGVPIADSPARFRIEAAMALPTLAAALRRHEVADREVAAAIAELRALRNAE